MEILLLLHEHHKIQVQMHWHSSGSSFPLVILLLSGFTLRIDEQQGPGDDRFFFIDSKADHDRLQQPGVPVPSRSRQLGGGRLSRESPRHFSYNGVG